jgi:hypothetical protein
MRVFERRKPWIAGLLLAAWAGASTTTPVLAQEPPPPAIDCGPVNVRPGDLVAVNVGHPGRAVVDPVVLHARLLDAEGSPLTDVTLTLAAGQSRAVSVKTTEGGLVRGEIVPVSGPSDLILRATVQVTRENRLRLTYGPTFECSGPTASRGPV